MKAQQRQDGKRSHLLLDSLRSTWSRRSALCWVPVALRCLPP